MNDEVKFTHNERNRAAWNNIPWQLKIFTKFTILPLFKLGTSDRLIFYFKEFSFIVIYCTLLMKLVCITKQVTPLSVRGVFLCSTLYENKRKRKPENRKNICRNPEESLAFLYFYAVVMQL